MIFGGGVEAAKLIDEALDIKFAQRFRHIELGIAQGLRNSFEKFRERRDPDFFEDFLTIGFGKGLIMHETLWDYFKIFSYSSAVKSDCHSLSPATSISKNQPLP